jgi:hypothetical protein
MVDAQVSPGSTVVGVLGGGNVGAGRPGGLLKPHLVQSAGRFEAQQRRGQ